MEAFRGRLNQSGFGSLSGIHFLIACHGGSIGSMVSIKGDVRNAPFKEVTFQEKGVTDTPDMIWSGDLLMDLKRWQALKITSKVIEGADFLFIESGGFSNKNPVGWKTPLIVMKRK